MKHGTDSLFIHGLLPIGSYTRAEHRLFCIQKQSLPLSVFVDNILSRPTANVFAGVQATDAFFNKIAWKLRMCIYAKNRLPCCVINNNIPSCRLYSFLILQHLNVKVFSNVLFLERTHDFPCVVR